MAATTVTTTITAPAAPVTLRLEAFYQLGPDTYRVPMSLHEENRQRLAKAMRESGAVPSGSIMLFAGGVARTRHDTDHEELFRQESNFAWLFGVKEPDCYGTVDVDTGRSVLFVPRLPPSYAVWMGEILPPNQFKAMYAVDECKYVDELASHLAAAAPSRLCRVQGRNTDSGATAVPASFEGIERFTTDDDAVFRHITNLRVFKTAAELDLMRSVNETASRAHLAVMRAVRPGMAEYQLESLFLHSCYSSGGHRHAAYTCICGAGINSAVLHYGHAGAPNSRVLADGDMCLMDMGTEYHCYGADITCSYPANGVFSPNQRAIYGAVLRAMRAVEAAMRPGVAWLTMHRLANRVIVEDLLAIGLLQNGTVDELLGAHMGAVFMPHGLGHLLGIDTHDVGGYPDGMQRIDEPGVRSLRTLRTLEPNMVITVEPGVYFIRAVLDAALANPAQARFINAAKLAEFAGFGGVRLEDDVIVTETGCEVMTKVPRDMDDIERIMAEARRQDNE